MGKTTPGKGVIEASALAKGLQTIEKEDEVTLIVIPESLALKLEESKALCDKALQQCATLEDRFVVMDADLTKQNPATGVRDIFNAANDFRSHGIGSQNLKYGAAYGPTLETVFDYAYDEKTVKVTIEFATPDETGAIPETVTSTMDVVSKSYAEYYPLVKSAIASQPVVLPAAPLWLGSMPMWTVPEVSGKHPLTSA